MALHCHTKIALALPLIMHARRPCANYTRASKRKALRGADILTSSYLVPQIEFQWLRLAVSPLSTGLSSLVASLSEPAYVFDDGRGFRFEKLRCVLHRRWWFVVAVEQVGFPSSETELRQLALSSETVSAELQVSPVASSCLVCDVSIVKLPCLPDLSITWSGTP